MSIPRNLGNFADNVNTNGKVEVTGINATGTPSASTALLGNGTWGTVTTAPAGSTGQVQYNNAGAFGAISSGTSGQVLTSAGSGAAPTWASLSGGFTLATPIDTTSGTSIVFTGIPSGVKQIIVTFKQVSTNGTNYKLIQLGTSSGLQTTDYQNNATRLKSGTAIAAINASGGFAIYSQSASDWLSGSVIFTLENSSNNTWAASGILGDNYNGGTFTVAGYVTLSSVLTRVGFLNDGSDSFDQGQMNIAYL